MPPRRKPNRDQALGSLINTIAGSQRKGQKARVFEKGGSRYHEYGTGADRQVFKVGSARTAPVRTYELGTVAERPQYRKNVLGGSPRQNKQFRSFTKASNGGRFRYHEYDPAAFAPTWRRKRQVFRVGKA